MFTQDPTNERGWNRETGRQANRPVSEKGFRRTEVSRGENKLVFFTVGGERKTRLDVLFGQIGKIR